MTTAQEGEILTRVGPGTPMGALMREYWIPAAMSSELAPDGAPMRLMLLGEKLIAFRDSAGRVGVMDHRCPHRCASLFLGRNEAGGIRCVYHGWKFDADGNCLDQPNLPPQQDFRHKVRAKAYKVAERNGLVWVYMGAREAAPPLPALEAALLPESDVQIAFVQRRCNWLQALEGDIDTSHFGFLHVGSLAPEAVQRDNTLRFTVADRAPEYHAAETPWGAMYAAYRPAEDAATYWRFAHFLFPFWTHVPQGDFTDRVVARGWVPLDDTHTMFVHLAWKKAKPGILPLAGGKGLPGLEPAHHFLPNTTDWLGRWRLSGGEENDWRIDRAAQRDDVIYSGIPNVHLQDQAVTESMGPVTDFEFEHLAPSDRMITLTRRRLLRAVRALREHGTAPPGVDDPEVYLGARSGEVISDAAGDWRAIYAAQLDAALHPNRQAAE